VAGFEDEDDDEDEYEAPQLNNGCIAKGAYDNTAPSGVLAIKECPRDFPPPRTSHRIIFQELTCKVYSKISVF
jgi:hypothetical protein